ncbi:protein pigeon isoform X1 [Frankliniella occidentalis]|uniref:Protein pigeon isoform X1 n=1 Tax=Frankliniella occidentalis TaxID=133901 RepID=A0A6J1TLS9_FRAOC|nr:protein pigeon isoform X1 [Frankliniella occidentalis]XP_026293732.1 protein pigeon isoform X1 [Frankliniella occidentalis]
MVVLENLAGTLSGIVAHRLCAETCEWRVLGQEQDGTLLVAWVHSNPGDSARGCTCIGLYYRPKKQLQVLYQFETLTNVVQASINSSKTALVYVTKSTVTESNPDEKECCGDGQKGKLDVYHAFLIQLKEAAKEDEIQPQPFKLPSTPLDLGIERSSQIVVQFLYRSKDQPGDLDRFLVLIHHESVSLYHYKPVFDAENEHILKAGSISSTECVVRSFTWAQWDPIHQSLFYIHFRKPAACLVEGDDMGNNCPSTESGRRQESELAPTLSGLQFHDNMPHETVLNIPLNLPLLPKAKGSLCSLYEDDPIPLRVHDCSLDLTVVSDPRGMVCICHHYLYQPVGCHSNGEVNEKGPGDNVHFAYSVTLLHHGCVLHCVVPGISWNVARRLRPSFSLYGDHHMLVYAPGLFTHLLDIGLEHEPCCHILFDNDSLTIPVSDTACLVPLLQTNGAKETTSSSLKPAVTMLDLSTLDLVPISIAPAHLLCAFRGGPHGAPVSGNKKKCYLLSNQLSILHYVLVHLGNGELLLQLLRCIANQCMEVGTPRLLQEILVGGAYAAARKNLPSDAAALLPLLPLTIAQPGVRQEIKMNDTTLTLSQETLWNTAMMLLSPQQRLIPYRSDMWTRLYESLSASQQRATDTTCSTDSRAGARFRPSHVAEKLMVSLLCYQPEALSRCTTPLSPGGNFVGSGAAFSDVIAITGANRKTGGLDFLPFQETDSCTASKQEHVISVDAGTQGVVEDELCSCPFCEPYNTFRTDKENGLPFLELDSCAASKQELVVSVNLRELSVHLLKHAHRGQSPLHVHALATRYVAAQLDMSRSLCRQLCLAAKVDPRQEKDRGFPLIDSLDDARRRLLFWLLERFLLAADTLAFPLPQGFISFFSFLGYRTLPFSSFMQYSLSYSFELQVDVMKAIMSDIPDTPEGSARKLRLLQLLPRSRAKRLLNAWSHPTSLMVRAREHALHVLSGVEGARGPRSSKLRQPNMKPYQSLVNRGLAAFPSQDRLSPLDTFLDLLTAKASLAELDFGLLIEATIASTQDLTL